MLVLIDWRERIRKFEILQLLIYSRFSYWWPPLRTSPKNAWNAWSNAGKRRCCCGIFRQTCSRHKVIRKENSLVFWTFKWDYDSQFICAGISSLAEHAFINLKNCEHPRSAEAAKSLVRVFGRLRKHGRMTLPTDQVLDNPQTQITSWLIERYDEFTENLLVFFKSDNTNLRVLFFPEKADCSLPQFLYACEW